MLRLVTAFLLLILLCGVCSAVQYFTVDSNDFTVTAHDDNQGYLQFIYSERRNTSAVYTVGLKNVWEATNGDLSKPTAIQPLQGWTPYDIHTVNNTMYALLATGPINPNSNSRFSSVVLNCSFPLGPADLNSSFPAGMIDVNIRDYNWVDDNSTTQLVLTWYVNYYYNTPVNGDETSTGTLKTKAGKTVDFDGAYFAVNTTAKNGNMSVDVSLELALTYNNDSSSATDVYVVYDHFSGDLSHDPQFGFGSGPGSSLLWIIIIVVVIIAILVIILIAVIGFVLVRRRRRSYDSF